VVRDIIVQPKRENTAEWRRQMIPVWRGPASTEAILTQPSSDHGFEKLRHADFADQLTHLHSAATHHRRATSRFYMIFSMPGARIASQRPPWFMA
jgi:hypothetical protein